MTQLPNRDLQNRELDKRCLTDSEDVSDDSDREELNAMLGKNKQDGDDLSDKLLKEIEEEYNKADKTGLNINEHLANFINKRFAGKLKDAKLKEKFELYVRPGNCAKLKVPLVNHELWGKLKPPVKSKTSVSQMCNKPLLKLPSPSLRQQKKICKANEKMDEKPKIISSLTDSLALFGHATYDLSLRRRDIMRPSVNQELQALCNQQIPVTDFMFGDHLQSSLKTIKECNKIANSVTQECDYKHSYSGAGNQRGRGSKPFLGQRKSYNTFRKKPWAPNHCHRLRAKCFML